MLLQNLATQMGVTPAFLTIPMLQASNLGRGLSPVSGVVVAVSGMGKISPFEIVKRMSVPHDSARLPTRAYLVQVRTLEPSFCF